MTVIRLSAHREIRSGHWHRDELRELEGICAAFVTRGVASSYAVGMTERGDPQFYVLASAPDADCVLCITRVGSFYLVEDGAGGVIAKVRDLRRLAAERQDIVARSGRTIAARGLVTYWAVRKAIEDDLEPMMAEPIEILTHIAPQFAALV
jgi:hypothetical protein